MIWLVGKNEYILELPLPLNRIPPTPTSSSDHTIPFFQQASPLSADKEQKDKVKNTIHYVSALSMKRCVIAL